MYLYFIPAIKIESANLKSISMKKIKTEVFQEFVQSKYELYNGLFMSLPFDGVRQTGMLLPVFEESCKKGFQKNQRPDEIVEEFFFSHCAHFTKE